VAGEKPMDFNHFDENGSAVMVDVSGKQKTVRTAIAAADIHMSEKLLTAIRNSAVSKGDVLGVARLAGIMAAKKTPELIPLSHPLALHSVAVDFEQDDAGGKITVKCKVRAFERTGVEMEAMTGAAVAALTIYDMCKGSDKSITICDIRLLYKEGGKSGVFSRGDQ
jgi:cyclic pyranopterin monophosphate synthase